MFKVHKARKVTKATWVKKVKPVCKASKASKEYKATMDLRVNKVHQGQSHEMRTAIW